jgi:hypothetical protein
MNPRARDRRATPGHRARVVASVAPYVSVGGRVPGFIKRTYGCHSERGLPETARRLAHVPRDGAEVTADS